MNSVKNMPPDSTRAQNSSDVVYAYDVSGKITFLNHEGERILGYSREEACRLNIAEVVDPSIAVHIAQQILRDAKERVGAVYEIDIIAKDGHRVALEVSTRVVWRDGGEVEVQGIAVPSVIRSLSQSPVRPQCVDKDYLLELHPR